MKIKVFESGNTNDLEKQVNEFLLGRNPKTILNIRHTTNTEKSFKNIIPGDEHSEDGEWINEILYSCFVAYIPSKINKKVE